MMAKYRFGDIVKEVKEKVDRNHNPYEFFIAGDHMDTDELHLLRRGRFADSDVGPAFIRVFKPGQVLYGSRRTYLRKIAVADFEGITANTTFVLESKDENILLQKLLPFIMQSERFTDFSIKKSKGSTNPYVLFSDLCEYEVELPDIEQQKRLSEILWAIDATRMAYKQLISATDELVKSQFIEMFGLPGYNIHGFAERKIRDVAIDVRYGTSKPGSEKGTFPYLRMNNITYEGTLDLSDLKYIDLSGEELEKCMVREGDLLFNRTNSRDLVGKTCVFTESEPMVIAGYIIRVRLDESVLPIYLSVLLNTDYGKALLRSLAKGAIGQANINAQTFQNIEIIVPPRSLQEEFAAFVRQSDKSKFAAQIALNQNGHWSTCAPM